MARTSARLVIASTACAVLALAGCGDEQVGDLTADPMASATPAGGELVTSREDEAEGGGLLGKPSPAKVLRAYAFESGAAAHRALSELLTEAEDTGWEVDSTAPDDSGFTATRTLDGRTATLTVVLNLNSAFPPAPGVFVYLISSDE
jgi:hypothetical protein